MNLPYLVFILRPKSPLSWLMLCITLFMAGVMFSGHLKLLKGWLVLVALVTSMVGIAAVIPCRWLIFWENRHHVLRGVVLGFLAYVALVTIGFFSELYSLRIWVDVIFLLEGSPFNSFHTAALAFAIFAYTTQSYYRPAPLPTESQNVLSGQIRISYEQAKQRIDELLRPKG